MLVQHRFGTVSGGPYFQLNKLKRKQTKSAQTQNRSNIEHCILGIRSQHNLIQNYYLKTIHKVYSDCFKDDDVILSLTFSVLNCDCLSTPVL